MSGFGGVHDHDRDQPSRRSTLVNVTTRRLTPEQASSLSLAEQHEWFRRNHRGPRPGSGLLAAGQQVSRAGLASRRLGPGLERRAGRLSGPHLPPRGRHLAFGQDPATQMSVSWQVPGQVASPFIRVGESRDDLSEPIAAEIRALTTPASVIIEDAGLTGPERAGVQEPGLTQYYLHARLTGLTPGRTYYYSVGHRGWDTAGQPDTVGSFTTAPLGRAPFTFTAFGDQGVTGDAAGVAALVRTWHPAFHLHAGDISYAESGGRGLVTDPYDPRVWDGFFAQIEPAAGSAPWQVAVGNHELEPWYSADGYGGQRARFEFPADRAGGPPPAYYFFTYGNVGFVSLDANDISHEIQANRGYTGGAQTAWLGGTLALLRADPTIDFIVVFFHHCAYCTCISHGSDGGVRDQWTVLFDQYAVDLVINGHNHVYERTDPLRAGRATGAAPPGATVYPASAGTTYIVAGAAGKSLYEFPAADSYEGAPGAVTPIGSVVHRIDGGADTETVTWSRIRFTGYCLLVVDSDPGWRPGAPSALRVRAVAADGAEIDRIDLMR
jgi:Purple acid Phosphatase, N-terminal domain/Calcineurin-like phosphoesterase